MFSIGRRKSLIASNRVLKIATILNSAVYPDSGVRRRTNPALPIGPLSEKGRMFTAMVAAMEVTGSESKDGGAGRNRTDA
jgi:hypothetical protein